MRTPAPQFRFRAVSMELAAHLDERRVDMLVIAADGTTVAIECEADTIVKVQRHIQALAEECPEVLTWGKRDKEAAVTPDHKGNTFDSASEREQQSLEADSTRQVPRSAH